MWIQWLALILVASPGALADEWNKTFTVSGKADVRVDVTDGEVSVRGWDRNEINARVSTVGWTIGSSEVRVTEHQVGDRLEIEVRTPRMDFAFGMLACGSIVSLSEQSLHYSKRRIAGVEHTDPKHVSINRVRQ